MLERLSSHQITEWIAYERLEPFGSRQDDLRAGMIAAAIATFFTWAFGEKGSKNKWKPEDFVPDYLNAKPKQGKRMNPEEIKSVFMALARERE